MSKHPRPQGSTGRRGLAAGALTASGFAASLLTPAQAVTLGDVSVQSALGQPLSARIPVQLGPGEMLGAGCVSVPTSARSDLSALPRPEVTVPEAPGAGSFELRITTSQPLYEPMYELQVQVRCAGTPLMVRQYVLMLDLPGTVQPAALAAAAPPVPGSAAETAAAPAAPAAAPEPARSSRPARPRPHVAPGAPIAGGTRYRVAAGDTLSTIAARVGGRSGQGIWRLADQIFAANPQAFIGGNPDLIKLGSEIVIPGSAAETAAPVAASVVAPAAAAAAVPAPSPPVSEAPAAAAPPATAAIPAGAEPAPAPALEAEASATPVFEDEQPAAPGGRAARAEPPVAAQAEPLPAAAERTGAPPWLAALIGVLIGAAVSLALLRDRLVAAVSGLLALRKPAIEPMISAPAPAAPAAKPAPQFSKPLVAREPSMVVEEHRPEDVEDDPLGRTDESITVAEPSRAEAGAGAGESADDLASLFGQEPDLPLYEGARDALPSAEELDLDLSPATGDATVDEDISWIGDDTALTPTAQSAALQADGGAETVEHIDLQTLSQRAGDDAGISQTLRDALNLLENDYEDELTASQVIDRNKLERMLDAGDADDTLVRTGTDQLPRRR